MSKKKTSKGLGGSAAFGIGVFIVAGALVGYEIGFIIGMIAFAWFGVTSGENYKRRQAVRRRERSEESKWRRQAYHKEKGSQMARQDFQEEESDRELQRRYPLGTGDYARNLFR